MQPEICRYPVAVWASNIERMIGYTEHGDAEAHFAWSTLKMVPAVRAMAMILRGHSGYQIRYCVLVSAVLAWKRSFTRDFLLKKLS